MRHSKLLQQVIAVTSIMLILVGCVPLTGIPESEAPVLTITPTSVPPTVTPTPAATVAQTENSVKGVSADEPTSISGPVPTEKRTHPIVGKWYVNFDKLSLWIFMEDGIYMREMGDDFSVGEYTITENILMLTITDVGTIYDQEQEGEVSEYEYGISGDTLTLTYDLSDSTALSVHFTRVKIE